MEKCTLSQCQTDHQLREDLRPWQRGCRSIVVSTDRFARCVELSGDENEDAFGWRFEDNFFDLLPFESRRVAISGRHCTGMISAKAHYSDHITKIAYSRKTQ